MNTRLFSVIGIASVMTFSVVSVAKAVTLTDITNHPHRIAIEFLQEQGIISGYPDETFRPDDTVNRGELAKILVLSLNLDPSADEYHDCFPDVAREWFARYVCFAKDKGWVAGYPDGSFQAGNTVNTAEAIKMIVVASGYPEATNSVSPYDDVDAHAWYFPFVRTAFDAVILPTDTPVLGIAKYMNRGDVAEVLYQALTRTSAGTPLPDAKKSEEVPVETTPYIPRHRNGEALPNSTGVPDTTVPAQKVPTISFNNATKSFGDPPFVLSPYSNSAGLFIYSSSNTSVAKVLGDTVTITGGGTATITVQQLANGNYAEGTATATVTILPIKPSINALLPMQRSSSDPLTFELVAPLSNSTGTFTYTSSDPYIATISGNTVTVLRAGATLITATQAATSNYTTGSVSASLTIASE